MISALEGNGFWGDLIKFSNTPLNPVFLRRLNAFSVLKQFHFRRHAMEFPRITRLGFVHTVIYRRKLLLFSCIYVCICKCILHFNCNYFDRLIKLEKLWLKHFYFSLNLSWLLSIFNQNNKKKRVLKLSRLVI